MGLGSIHRGDGTVTVDILEHTVLMVRPQVRRAVPMPLATGNATRDRLVMQAYRRLQSRLNKPQLTGHQRSQAVADYRRVVVSVLGNTGLDRWQP